MNILFIHQSFPGQYRHIIRSLSHNPAHTIVGLGIDKLREPIPDTVKFFQYSLIRANTPGIHKSLLDIDSKFIRGESCAIACFQLKDQGFYPDVVCAHPGWGEALFLQDVWPDAPMLCYQEFFYNSKGFDSGFDSEFQPILDWNEKARLRLKNCNPLLMLESSSWNVTPTLFQKSSIPICFHSKTSVIHDGIDTNLASPSRPITSVKLSNGTILDDQSSIITFVNRHIEPYRGCHSFIRAIPSILSNNPNSHIVIVGDPNGVSYGTPPLKGLWRDIFLSEIANLYDASRLHFTGPLTYNIYLNLLRISSCHVYLTYPFVLSWSLLEAMSFALPIVGSRTAPVEEVITHNKTGLLANFFSPDEIASSVTKLLEDKELSLSLGNSARELVVEQFSLKSCLPKHLNLINFVSSNL